MWLPFFCNTTNIITSEMEIHQTGYAWRFIRQCLLGAFDEFPDSITGASMTLVGLLPPLCENGGMLVDGGYREIQPYLYVISTDANLRH